MDIKYNANEGLYIAKNFDGCEILNDFDEEIAELEHIEYKIIKHKNNYYAFMSYTNSEYWYGKKITLEDTKTAGINFMNYLFF